jgi:hypothetical protein
MRSPIDVIRGRVGGFTKREIARRTVPCYKHVLEAEGRKLALCLLVDSRKLYRFPDAYLRIERGQEVEVGGIRSLELRAKFLRAELESYRLRELQPGICRYVDPDRRAASGA